MKRILLLSLLILSVVLFLSNCAGTITLSHTPEITKIEYQGTLMVGEKITIVIQATDKDNDIVSYTITVISPSGSVTNITNTTGIFGNIELKEAGEHTVVALVKDSKNNKASKTDTFNVAEKPVPTCEVSVSSSKVTVGGKVSVWVVGNEPGGTIDKAEIAILKNGVKSYNVCTTNSCAINNFTANEEGEYTVVGTVTDGFGQVATDSATFVAEEIPNATPSCVIVVKPSTDVAVGEQVKGEITGSDPDGVDNIQKTEIALVQDPDNTYRVCNSNFCESKEYTPATVSEFTFIGTVTDIYGAWATCVATFVTHEASQPWIKFDIAKIEPPIRPDRDPTCLIWVNSPVKLVAKSSLGEPIGIESVKFRMYKDSLSGNMEGEVAVDHTNADGEWEGQLTPTHEGTYVFVVNGWQEAQALGDPDASDVITCVATQNAAPVAHVSFNTDELECCGTMTINMLATDDRWIKVATLVVSYVNENGERKENTFTFRTNNDYQTSWCDKYEFHPYVGDVIATLTVSDDYGRTGSASAKSKVIDTYPPKLEFAAVPDGGNARYVTVGGRLVTETSTRVEWCFTAPVHRYATASDECSEFRMRYTHCDGCESEFTVRDKLWQYNEGDGDYLNDEGIYFFDIVATQINGSDYGGIKTSSIHATVIVDTTDPTVSVFATKVCASDTLHVRYTATDLHFKSATLSVDSTYVGFNSPTEVSVNAGENQTESFKFESTDRATVVVKIEAVDECGNTTHTSYATTVDNIFGGIEFSAFKPDKPTTIATFNGTITDLSGVCTVASYLTHNLGEGNATLTIELPNYNKCESTQVTFKATVEVVETDATDVKVTIRATDCCCCSNPADCDCNGVSRNSTTATLTITFDGKFGYASMAVATKTCSTDVTIEGTMIDKSDVAASSIEATPIGQADLENYDPDSGTFTAKLEFPKVDRTQATITLTATDTYGNATEVVATMIVDTMFRSIEATRDSDVATSGDREVSFNGTLTDLSSICEATVTSATAVSHSSGTYSITVEATLKDAEGCVATQATFEGTVSVEGEVEGIATITVVGTDCCCGKGCGEGCHSSNVIFTVLIDTMPPSRTYGPEVSTDTDIATVNIGFHEEAKKCNTYLATMTYHVTDGVDKNYTATSNIFTVDDNMLHIRFDPATSAASMTKATITYTGICDDYGNGPTEETSITWTKQ